MAKAFPSDNPILHGYYGPVNTEADAGHLHITGEMPKELTVTATSDDGKATIFKVLVRIDTPQELQYYKHGGILEYVLRQLAGKS